MSRRCNYLDSKVISNGGQQAHIAAAEQLIGGGDSESLASRQTGDAGDEDLVSRQFCIQKNAGAFRSLHASGAIQCTCQTPERMHLPTALTGATSAAAQDGEYISHVGDEGYAHGRRHARIR